MEKLNEVFIYPTAVEQVGSLDSLKLYSSVKLRDKLIQVMREQTHDSAIAKKIENLITKGDIIPCLTSKSVLGFIAQKVFLSSQGTQAFYSGSINKVFLLLSKQMGIIPVVKDSLVSYLVTHELMHMGIHRKDKLLFNPKIKETLEIFYNFFLQEMFNVKKEVPKELLVKYVDYLCKHTEFGNVKGSPRQLFETLKEMMKPFEDFFLKHNKNEKYIREVSEHLCASTVIQLFFPEKYWSATGAIRLQYMAIKNAYKLMGAKVSTFFSIFFGQELIFPSEVIAVLSEDNKFSGMVKVVVLSC